MHYVVRKTALEVKQYKFLLFSILKQLFSFCNLLIKDDLSQTTFFMFASAITRYVEVLLPFFLPPHIPLPELLSSSSPFLLSLPPPFLLFLLPFPAFPFFSFPSSCASPPPPLLLYPLIFPSYLFLLSFCLFLFPHIPLPAFLLSD